MKIRGKVTTHVLQHPVNLQVKNARGKNL